MKKRLLRICAVALAASMVLIMGACGSMNEDVADNGKAEEVEEKVETAYSLYTSASKAMQDASEFSMVLDMSVTGGAEDVVMKGPFHAILSSDEDREMAMNMNVTKSGQDFTINMYYKGGYAYFDASGVKFKQTMDEAEADAQAHVGRVEFPESAIKNQIIKEIPNGKELTFSIEGSKVDDVVKNTLGDMKDIFGDMAFDYSDLTFVATLDESDNLTGIMMNAEVSSSADPAKKGLVKFAIADIKLDGVVIEAPADLSSYPEGIS